MKLLRILFFILLVSPLYAIDIAVFDSPNGPNDKRKEYPELLLKTILEHTVDKYGPYEFRYSQHPIEGKRLLLEVQTGTLANITAQFSRPEWETDLLAVRLPIDKGITSYRIFLINAADQASFSKIRTLEELKKNKIMGAQFSWFTYQVFKELGFNIESGSNYEGLFNMLKARRFNYLPRGIHEAFSDVALRSEKPAEIAVESSLALYVPLPRYFFVSPTQPRLAKRIQEGFELIIKDGTFDRVFMDYHKQMIEETNFCQRRIFRLNNPLLDPRTPINRSELWFDPFVATSLHGKAQAPLCSKAKYSN